MGPSRTASAKAMEPGRFADRREGWPISKIILVVACLAVVGVACRSAGLPRESFWADRHLHLALRRVFWTGCSDPGFAV